MREEFFEVGQRLLAEGFNAAATSGETRSPGWKERRIHLSSIYTGLGLTGKLK